MKAIQVKQAGAPEAMELVDLPIPQPKPNEAVVKVSVAGVNAIDGQFRDGSLRTPLPFIPGQEGAGVVSAVGAQTKTVKVGDPRTVPDGKNFNSTFFSPEELDAQMPNWNALYRQLFR